MTAAWYVHYQLIRRNSHLRLQVRNRPSICTVNIEIQIALNLPFFTYIQRKRIC